MLLLGYVALLAAASLTQAQSAVIKRAGNCTALPTGKGPVPSPDSALAFVRSKDLADSAKNAPTPANYTQSFKNLNASSTATNYLGYITLDSYDTDACAANCTAKQECQAINIFFERDPTLELGPNCPDPPSTTNIKCVFWGSAVTKANTNNQGYEQELFQVAVAGSNGYYNQRAGKVEG